MLANSNASLHPELVSSYSELENPENIEILMQNSSKKLILDQNSNQRCFLNFRSKLIVIN